MKIMTHENYAMLNYATLFCWKWSNGILEEYFGHIKIVLLKVFRKEIIRGWVIALPAGNGPQQIAR